MACASHDTASAVAAITARGGTAFISSGTWSLVGTEVDDPVITPKALHLNFSNEGGVGHTICLLKNVMGLWMLQGCRRSWADLGRKFAYGELMEAAGRESGFRHLVDPDEASFVCPRDMPDAIDRFCAKTGQPAPAAPGAYARALRNGFIEEWLGREGELRRRWKEVLPRVRAARAAGDADRGTLLMGEDAGLIDSIEPAAALVERLAAEAEAILRKRARDLVGG